MKITDGIYTKDLALYIKPAKILVISDIHIGYEDDLNKKGFLIPRVHFKEMIDRLGKIMVKTNPETIIITGDLKHQFGSISDQEWRDTLRFFDFLAKSCKNIIIVKGNHDTILTPIARKRSIKMVDYFSVKTKIKGKSSNIYICHGDVIPESKDKDFAESDIVIIGHEHPAARISDGIRTEKFKCFIYGKWKPKKANIKEKIKGKTKMRNKELIVLPSMNLATEGTDLKSDKLLSPFLQQNIENFDVYIPTGEEVLYYGKLRSIE